MKGNAIGPPEFCIFISCNAGLKLHPDVNPSNDNFKNFYKNQVSSNLDIKNNKKQVQKYLLKYFFSLIKEQFVAGLDLSIILHGTSGVKLYSAQKLSS